eukprot:scaffold284503_cov28-Tisochrysis_lutea.AAC.3
MGRGRGDAATITLRGGRLLRVKRGSLSLPVAADAPPLPRAARPLLPLSAAVAAVARRGKPLGPRHPLTHSHPGRRAPPPCLGRERGSARSHGIWEEPRLPSACSLSWRGASI